MAGKGHPEDDAKCEEEEEEEGRGSTEEAEETRIPGTQCVESAKSKTCRSRNLKILGTVGGGTPRCPP